MEVTIFDTKAKFPFYYLMKFDFLRKKSFAIDLGNTNTQVRDVDKLLVDQPSYIVLDSNRAAVKAVGTQAYRMFEKYMSAIELSIIQTLETCPPELASDIYVNGIYVTGGNALLRGLQARLERKLKVSVHIDADPLLSVSKGVATVLREPKKYKGVLMH